MSDQSLNRFLASGTAAERAAFTPTPPTPASGPDPAYWWTETDTGKQYWWDGAAWQPANAAGAIGDAQLRDSAALSVIGRASNSSGDPADIAAANDGEVLRRSGTTLGFGTVATAGLADDAATNAKLANMAQATIKGRAVSAGTGDPTDLTATQATAVLEAVVGDSGAGGTKGLVPAPAAGDAGHFLRGDGTWAEPAAVLPPSNGATFNTFVVNGCQVVWVSGLQFRVSAGSYYINGTLYTSAEQTVTLDAADGSNPRIDVIALDTAVTVQKITGTAAAAASEPTVDPASYVKLALVSVPTGATAPAGASTTTLYAENAGSGGGEWNWTASAGSIVVNSTNNPHAGSTDIEGTAVAAGVYARGQKGSGSIAPNDYAHVLLFLRSKATWSNSRGLLVSFRSSGVLVGTAVQIRRSGTFGFDSSSTSAYQQVAIPITAFAIPLGTTANQLQIEDFGGSIGFYIDDISLQVSASTPATTGITEAQADARYARLVHATRHQSGGGDPLSVLTLAGFPGGATTFLRADATFARVPVRTLTFVLSNGSSDIAAATKTVPISFPVAGTITGAKLLSEQTGAIVIDVWKDTYSNHPPTVADTITASAKPTLSAANKANDTTLTGWTTSVAAGDVFIAKVDSCTGIQSCSLQLTIEV